MVQAITFSSRWNGLRDLCRWQRPKQYFSHLATESSKTGLSHPLRGPPEIYLPSPSADQCLVRSSEPLLDRLASSSFYNTKVPPKPPTGLAKVELPSFDNPCLDFFIYVFPNKQPLHLKHYLMMAWNHNPLTTLKLICHWRDAREMGKPKRETFYHIALWLCHNHPKTLAYNLKSFAKFGYLKDLLEILYRGLNGPRVQKIKEKGVRKMTKKADEIRRLRYRSTNSSTTVKSAGQTVEKNLVKMVKVKVEKELGTNTRWKRRIVMAKEAVDKYNNNPNYQSLHNQISDIFAQLLKTDMDLLKHGETSKLSFAAKWCPSLNSSYDRSTLICESIARRIFPRDSDPEYKEIEEAHYAYRVRDRLRKQVLVPLREALKIPESCCKSSSMWDNINQFRVGYVAMIKYKSLWRKTTYFQRAFDKDKLLEGRVFRFPHNLCSLHYESGLWENECEMVEKQWREMVKRLRGNGKFGRCLAVCDSMSTCSSFCIDIIRALSLVVSDVTEEPWRKFIVRFRADGPRLKNCGGGTLEDTITDLRAHICTSENRDLKKIADLILQFALDYELGQDEMIDRLFVFSHYDFDEAFEYDHLERGEGWQRDYEIMRNKFEEKNYTFPEIVFWSNCGSRYHPVLSLRKGVTILNGHSKSLMTYFLEEGGRINPEDMMQWAISGEEYKDLVVLD